MDRLVWYYHARDAQCLHQAVAVARKHPVDLRRIESWSEGEGPNGSPGFQAFLERLRAG